MTLNVGENNIGKTVYIATSLPATNDAAGFEALTWTKVTGIQSIGERGVSHSGIDVEDLEWGFVTQVKGAGAGVDTTLVFYTVDADTGQGDIRTAAEGDSGKVSIKIGEGSGTAQALVTGDPVEYAAGIVHSYRPREATVNSSKGFSVVFRNNALWVDSTEPA